MSGRNRSANATWVKPSSTARATSIAIACSYWSFEHGDGIGTCHSARPSPYAALGRDPVRPEGIAVPQLDDHLWRARQDRFGAHADGLAFDVADHIGAARRFEHVVQKSVAAARLDAPQRSRFASKDQQRLRARTLRDAGA